MHTFLVVAEILIAIFLITVIMLQPSKTGGFGNIISGNSETFYSKNKTRTKESLLIKLTVVAAILFAIVIIALYIVK